MAVKIKPYRVSGPNPDVGMFTETIKFEVLACGNISSNNNKFYCIELQKDKKFGLYRLFTHYGRIGKTNVYEVRDSIVGGGEFTDSNLSVLEAEYEKILKKKKRVSKGKSTYETVDTQEPSVGSENIRNKKSASSTGSTISKGDLSILSLFSSPDTKSMVRSVWEENIHNITNMTTMTVSSSGISTPLGALTIPHVDKAMNVLSEIKNQYSHIPYNTGELEYFNQKYFSMIPHPFGSKIPKDALIDDDNKFMTEFDLLEQMKAAIQVSDDNDDDNVAPEIPFDIDIVDHNSELFEYIEKRYVDSRASCHGHLSGWSVKNLFALDHHSMTDNYVGYKPEHKGVEYDLFHGSRACNILSIMMNGLMVPPKTAGHVTGRMFGDGIYGASASTKALNYATGYWAGGARNKHRQAYMFVVRFAMGKIYYPTGTLYNGPPGGYDSVWAKKEETSLANDEFIVYDTSQAKITHLLQLEETR